MRSFINAARLLTEGTVAYNDGNLVILRNPVAGQIRTLLERSREQQLRGFVIDGDFYVWDAYLATHDRASDLITIGDWENFIQIFVDPKGVVIDSVDFAWVSNFREVIAKMKTVIDRITAFRRMFGGDIPLRAQRMPSEENPEVEFDVDEFLATQTSEVQTDK
jgi:hypothetical protein